jgi:hypothetical protein
MKAANNNKPLSHKERMAKRRAGQLARESATLVMTQPKFRGLVAAHKAHIAAQNEERAAKGEPPLSNRMPARNIILCSKYMPHQGKRECERRQRAMGSVQYAEAA